MKYHYSQPRGFCGRQLIYEIRFSGTIYGNIAAGSAVQFLPNRKQFFGDIPLASIVNNGFYSISKIDGRYPIRNFSTAVVALWRSIVAEDWFKKYGDRVMGWETLVELPRTGELYRRDGWTEIGVTKGYTCKRVAEDVDISTDSWTGRRIWDTTNLRPKRVLARMI